MKKKSSDNEQSPSKRFYQRRSVKILASLFLLVLVVRLSLPIGIKIYLTNWLENNGADSASIEKVRFGPFMGTAGLEGVTIEKAGKTVFSNSTIFVDIGLRNLLGHTALIQKATLEDVVIDMAQNEDGSYRIASYTLQAGKKEQPVEETVETVVVDAEKEDVSWMFFANEITLQNVTVRYSQPTLDVELVIEEAHIEKFNTDPTNLDGSLMVRARVNDAPVHIDMEKFIFSPYLDLEGSVKVEDFLLDGLALLLQNALNSFSGVAGLDGRVAFSLKDGATMSVSYDGSIGLADGNIGGTNWATGGTVSWDGKASFGMNSGEMEVVTDGDLQALKASFDIPQPLIDIDNSDILISGKTEVQIAEEVTVDTTASLTLAPTTYLANGFQTGAGDASWAGRIQVNTGTEQKGLGVLAEGKISIAEPVLDMDMEKGQMEIGNGLLAWDGKVEYRKGAGDAGDEVLAKGKLEGEGTFFRLPEAVDFSQKQLVLDGETTVSIGQPLAVQYAGDFSLAETAVEVGNMSIGDDGLKWSGKVGYQLADRGQAIDLNGLLEGSGISFGMAGPGLEVVQKQLEFQPEFSLQLGEKPTFEGKIGLRGADLAVDLESAPLVTLEQVAAEGFSGDGSGGFQGQALNFEKLVLHSSNKIPVQGEIPGISITGIQSPDLMSATVEKITVSKPAVKNSDGMKRLAELEHIVADNVSVDKDLTASVERIVVDQGTFLSEEDKDALATLKQLLVEKIGYSPSEGLSCDAVTLDSVYGNIYMAKKEQGQPEPEKNEETEQVTEKAEPSAIPVKINRIDVVGESGVKYADPNLHRTFITTMNVDSLEVRDLDLTQPDKPFTYSLKGAIDKYTPVKVSGQVAPLAQELFIEQEATIHNLSMLHISPYSVEAIGIFFPTGMMNFTSSLKIGEGMIDMDNNLVISDISVEEVQGDLAAELNNQLPVPFDLAMTMLKDGEGKIDLDVPINGKLAEMNIGIADIIWTPLSNAITIAVTPYLAYTALGPAGALTYFGTKLGKKMFETKLPTLEFEPGETGLTDEHRKKLDKAGKKIAKELKNSGDDSKAFIICAKVSVAELTTVSRDTEENQEVFRNEEIRRELFKLGESRALAVKDYLTATHEIPAEKLEVCNPGLNFDETAKPKIEFMQ